MNKCHSNLNWLNDTTPAINDTNLNYMDGCIDTIDSRVVSMDSTKLEAGNIATVIKNVSVNDSTGVFTFTRYDNSTFTVDTMLEKVVTNFGFDETTQKLTITLEDGTTKQVDLSSFIKETEVADTDTVALSLVNHKLTATVKGNSIGDAQMQTQYLADCQSAKNTASSAATSSNTTRLQSEGYALGTQDSVPVGSDSIYYHNNAKWYKDQAQAIASSTLGGLSDVTITSPSEGQSLVYDSETATWVNGDGNVKFALLPVSNLSAIGVSEGITLSWTNPSDVSVGGTKVAEFDHVEIRKDNTVIASSVSGNSYTDTNVTSGVEYTYTVYAITTSGVYSESASVVGSVGFSVKAWAELAGLNYTSLSAITETDMRTLMTKHASCDYLAEAVESDSSVMTDFIANTYAMKWIGLRDYICDKLMAISAVKSAMLASSSWEYILKDHVPIMTSDSAPYGNVVGSATNSNYPMYFVFDGNDTSNAVLSSASTNSYVYYKFTNPINVRKFDFLWYGTTLQTSLRISYSDDGTNWTDTSETYTNVAPNKTSYSIEDCGYHLYWRLTKTQTTATSGFATTIQFYGRSLNISVPTMTSNTSPYGEALSDGYENPSYPLYLAFDGNNLTYYQSSTPSETNNSHFGYTFKSPIKLKKVMALIANSSSVEKTTTVRFEYKTSTSDWVETDKTITVTQTENNPGQFVIDFDMENVIACRFKRTDSVVVRHRIYTLNFFGLDYSERTDRTYLYDHGLEIVPISSRKTSYGTEVATKNSDNLYIAQNSKVAVAAFYTDEIDFTNKSIMRATVKDIAYTDQQSTRNLLTVLGVGTSAQIEGMPTSGLIGARYILTSDLPNNGYLDVSSISGNYKAILPVYSGASEAVKQYINFNEWWLE